MRWVRRVEILSSQDLHSQKGNLQMGGQSQLQRLPKEQGVHASCGAPQPRGFIPGTGAPRTAGCDGHKGFHKGDRGL